MVLAWPSAIWQLPLSSAMAPFESVEWFPSSLPVAPVVGGWPEGARGSTGLLPGSGSCGVPVLTPVVPPPVSGMPMPMPPLGPPL